MYTIQYRECNHREINYFNKGNIAMFGFQYDLEKCSEGAGNSGWQSVLSMSDNQRGKEDSGEGSVREISMWSKEHGEESLISLSSILF